MPSVLRTLELVAVAALLMLAAPRNVPAQSLVLDPLSASLPGIPATSATILNPSTPPPAGLPPTEGLSNAQLGLLPADVIDALWYLDDPAPGPGVTSYFSVSRGPMGPLPIAPPDVGGESLAFLPLLTQGEAAGDLFVANDLTCLGPGVHTQILDGNGALLGPPSACGYGGGAPFGLGLTELLPTPPVTFNDDLTAFDWSVPGRGRLVFGGCLALSLAAGSPTLVPGANPLLLPALGAEPADILLACPGPATYSSPGLSVLIPAAGLGLVSGGPGCAPPACDDIDALGGAPTFSLSPTSPSVTGPPFFSAADVLGPGPVVVLAAASLGLLPTDDVDALESTINPCPLAAGADGPDFDGVAAGPGCDNCPATLNPGQEDSDFDGIGDVCDPCTDADGEGFGSPGFPASLCPLDLCPLVPSTNADSDGDGVGDECDNCPGLANTNQADGDFDGVGTVCDNCPLTNNPAQLDADGDLIGDDCDSCTGGFAMTKPAVKIGKLLTGPGTNQIQAKGTIGFPGLTLPIPPLDVVNPAKGMRLELVDLGAGSAVVFDYAVPGGLLPTACGPKDGWKTNTANTSQKYGNKTNQNQNFACAVGSAQGITGAQAKDKTATLKGAAFQVKGKNGTYGPVVGPLRMTVVLGGAAESAGGQCGVHTFAPANCVLSGGGKTLQCK